MAEPPPEPVKPAVPIRKSITPDYLICLEDGKKLKMLKRHLRSTYNMTPDEYRARWGLAPDYPMVAPNYAEQRSAFAKKIGLGRGAARQSAARGQKIRLPPYRPDTWPREVSRRDLRPCRAARRRGRTGLTEF